MLSMNIITRQLGRVQTYDLVQVSGQQESNRDYLAGLSRVHGDGSVGQQILQLQSFTQVSVPYHAAVLNAHILKGGHTLVNVLASILQSLLGPEHGCVILQVEHDIVSWRAWL